MWDNHMHSNFSGDSKATPESMIASAKEKGLLGITFTDHLDINYMEEPGLFDLDIEGYFSSQQALAKKLSTKDFQILTGIEVGLMPSTTKENLEAVSSADFDFVIGSTHVVDGRDPYYEAFWQGKNADLLLHRYYEVILENICTFDNFDSLGHLDYCFRYVPKLSDFDTYTKYQEIVDAILEKLIKMDKALEVNTGAYKKGLPEPNPCSTIIKRYHALGGKLITIGADAHEPAHVALGFEKLCPLLNECGFKEFAVYKKRIPNLYPIA